MIITTLSAASCGNNKILMWKKSFFGMLPMACHRHVRPDPEARRGLIRSDSKA